VKADDSSLSPNEYQTVHEAARKLLDRAAAWDRLPTPVDDLLAAANLKVAPLSAFDESAMQRYLRQAGELASRFLKRAVEKVLGVLDVHGNLVHVDPTVNGEKQCFIKLHETGHKEIPHQYGLFRWIQECRQHLQPETTELFEREANTFASIVLFQDGKFAAMTADYAFGIKVPLNAAKKFGASVYAGIREYVRRNQRTCAVIILDPTETRDDLGRIAVVRRTELSPGFRQHFGALVLPEFLSVADPFMKFVPFGQRRMSSPGTFVIKDRNGASHEFVGEGFQTPYNTFVLIHARQTLTKRSTVASEATLLLP
jgi:hypothetical protein